MFFNGFWSNWGCWFQIRCNVCQLVSVEHFSRKTFFKMAAKKIKEFNCFTFCVIQNTICKCKSSQFQDCVLGYLPSFLYFNFQDAMAMWLMTSRDPKRSRSCPRYIWMHLSRKPIEINAWFQRTINTKWHDESNGRMIADVTWPWKVKVVTPICLAPSISKTAGHTEWLQLRIYRKLAPAVSNGHVTDDVTMSRP